MIPADYRRIRGRGQLLPGRIGGQGIGREAWFWRWGGNFMSLSKPKGIFPRVVVIFFPDGLSMRGVRRRPNFRERLRNGSLSVKGAMNRESIEGLVDLNLIISEAMSTPAGQTIAQFLQFRQ